MIHLNCIQKYIDVHQRLVSLVCQSRAVLLICQFTCFNKSINIIHNKMHSHFKTIYCINKYLVINWQNINKQQDHRYKLTQQHSLNIINIHYRNTSYTYNVHRPEINLNRGLTWNPNFIIAKLSRPNHKPTKNIPAHRHIHMYWIYQKLLNKIQIWHKPK